MQTGTFGLACRSTGCLIPVPFCAQISGGLRAQHGCQAFGSHLTSWLLEAVAPLVVGEFAVLEGVTGVKERLDAGLIFV